MANPFPDHGWRLDQFTLIRGKYTADVSRAWCAEDGGSWRWIVWDAENIDKDIDLPDIGERDNCSTAAEAQAGAEAFIARRHGIDAAEKIYAADLSVYRFAGLEPAPVLP